MKKRSISLLIIICMLFSIMPASFAAASDVFSATVVGQEINGVNEFYGESDDVYVRNGDVVEYIFSTNNTGKEIKGYQIDVNYDAEGFEFVSFDKGNILSSEDIDIADAQLVADGVAKLVVAYQSQKSYKDSGDEVATLKLKVKDISKISDGDVSAESVVKFADNSSEDAKITLKELYPIENTIILPAMSSEKYVIGQTGSMDVKLAYGDIEFKGFEFSIANTGNVEFFEFDLDNIVWSSQIKDVANNYEASLMEDGSVKVIITFDETTKVEDNLLTIPFKVTNAQIYGEFTEYTKGFVCDNNELVFKDGYHGFTISAASIIKAEVISSAWKTVDANNQTIASIPTGGINVVYNVKFSTVDEEYKIKGVQFDVRFADINCVSDLKVDVAEFADDNLSLEAIVVNNDTVRFVAYSNDTEPVYINGDIFKISFNTTNIECDDLISVENISFTGEDMSVDTSVQKVSITDSAQTILYGYSDGKAVIPGQSVNYTIYGQAIFGNIPATVRGVNFDIEYDSDNFTFNSLEFVGLLADSEATVEYEEIEAGKIRVVYASATQEVLNGDLLTLKLDVNKKAQQNVYPIGISNVSSAPANCVTGSLGEISVESSYDEIGIYSDNVAKPGENISVNIYDYAIAITGNEFNIVYDDSILEYIDFVTGSDLDDIIDVTIEKLENKSIIKVVYVTDGSTTYTSSEDAILATLNFKVKDDATLDTRTKLIVQDNVTTPVGAFEAEFSKLEQEIHIVADYGIIRITPEKEYVLRDEYEPIIVSVDLEDIEAMRALQFDLVSKQLINAEYIDGNLSTQYDEFYVEGNRVVVGASKENAINGNLHLGRFEFEFNLMNDYANIDALAISVDGLVYDYPVKIVNGVVSIVDTLPTPTPTPSVDPTPTPSVDPTPTPSVDPTPTPSVDPTPTPSVDPTPTPSVDPTPTPSVDPTPTPSVDPTPTPTRQPPRGGSSGGSREYVVTFNAGENGVITDIKKATVDVASGKTLAATDIPEVTANDGYKFLGWSLDGKVVVDPTTEKIYKATTFTALYEKGIVSTEHLAYILGYEDGTFKPDNGITRAETAAMICRTLLGGFDEKTTYKSELSDIKASEWYANYVGFMTKSDIIKGYEDNTFRPSNEITRQEFTAIITRLGEILEAKGMPFTDVTDDLWGIDNIYTAYSMGYINGYEDKTFRPNAAITRAEAVKIINKMLDRSITEKGLVDATYKVPTDLKTSHWAYYEVIEAYNDHKYSYDDNELEIWTKKSEN